MAVLGEVIYLLALAPVNEAEIQKLRHYEGALHNN